MHYLIMGGQRFGHSEKSVPVDNRLLHRIMIMNSFVMFKDYLFSSLYLQ